MNPLSKIHVLQSHNCSSLSLSFLDSFYLIAFSLLSSSVLFPVDVSVSSLCVCLVMLLQQQQQRAERGSAVVTVVAVWPLLLAEMHRTHVHYVDG